MSGRLVASRDEKDEILAEWVAEAERRFDAYDRGEIEAISLDSERPTQP